MQNEVKRRKKCIADVEVEVTRLMASAKQSSKLSNYINEYIQVHSDNDVYDSRYDDYSDYWEYQYAAANMYSMGSTAV